jgi:hypothetical protein
VTEVELKSLIEHGTAVQLVAMPRVHDLVGYTLRIDLGRLAPQELKARRGNVRVFKKLETIEKLAKAVGIDRFEVVVK